MNRLLHISAFALALAGFAMVASAYAREPVILKRGNMAEPDTLDPSGASTSWENNIVGDLMMGLTTEDAHARTIPGAAQSWTTSPDGLVWTFTLRVGLLWSDGAPVKASDFVFAFRRLLDPKTAAKYASVQYVIKNAEAINSGKLPLGQIGVRALDDRTIEIALEAQAPFLPQLLTHFTAFPIPEHVVRRYGENWVKPGRYVSNGPFKLMDWKPHDQVKLVKNELFYDAKNVRVDEVYFYPIEDETVALTRFRSGEIDANIGSRGFPMSELDWLRTSMPGVARVAPNLAVEYIAVNFRLPQFQDRRVRRALSLCLDRETLSKKVNRGSRVAAESFVPRGILNYNDSTRFDFVHRPMDERRAEARQLLREAGYSQDRPLTFDYLHMTGQEPRRSAIGESVMLRQCGIIARPQANEPKVHYNMIQQADFSVAKAAWSADFNDASNFLYLLDSRSGVFNYGAYKNDGYDRLLDEAKRTADLSKRARLMAQAEQMALDDVAIIPLSFPASRSLVATYIKGYEDNPMDIHRTRWMHFER